MPAFLPLHIAAIVLLAARLHALHSREHAPEKFIHHDAAIRDGQPRNALS